MPRSPLIARILTASLAFMPALAAAAAPDAAGQAADHAQRGLITLVWWEMFWTIVVFVIFFAVLSFVVWPRILNVLQDREEKQRSDLVTAEQAAKDAQATLAAYKQQLAEARKEAQTIVSEARAQAQQAANADKARIEAEMVQLRENAKRDIAAAREQAVADLYAQAATLGTQIAGKILKREINAQDQQVLVDESIEKLRHQAASN